LAFDPPEVNVSLIQDFIELITVYPGALVYQLVTLFAIQLIAGVAFGHWQRQRDEAAAQLLAMGIGLFLARVILMLVAVLDAVGLVSSAIVFPPLERFLHLVTPMLVVWAFLPILERNRRLSTPLLLVTTLVAAGTYAAFASLWPGAEAQGIVYNGYWQERVWELSTTTIVGLALIASLVWRGADWGWLICLLAVWLAGHVLQLVAPTPYGNTAGWVRLADLAALPLIAALTYRRALGRTRARVREAGESVVGTTGILEAVQRIKADDGLEPALELAAPSIASAVDADMAAVGLLVPGPIGVLRVIALHPPTSVMAAGQEPTLLLSKHPLLATASRHRRLERASADGRPAPVQGLYRRLGFDGSGPVLVQPLIVAEQVLGLIVVGNPESQRAWDTRDEQILQAIAYVLASAITGDAERQSASKEQLERAREEAQRMASRVDDLEARLERQRRRSEELSTKLRLREKEAAEQSPSSAALAVWQEEVRELAETRDALQDKLSQWQKKAQKLSQAKAELEEQLDQARSAAPQPGDGRLGGFLVSDEQGVVILASRNSHRMLGKPRSDLMGARFHDLFDEPWWKRTVDRLLNGSARPGEVTAVSLDLGERIVRAELTRLPSSEHWPGTLVALLHVAQGPTAERAMVASLIQELRTPMTSITGYTDLLLRERSGILGESQRRLLLRVEANIERMERLLNDLIKATDLDAGQMTLLPEPVQVNEVIGDALDVLSARLDEKNLEAKVDLPSELPPAYADRDSLRQILLNLLSNAALASEPGTQIQIRVGVEERPDDLEGLPAYLLVSVTDTGGGIAPEDRRRVFHRFYRADNPLIPGLGDTGVGLSVTKALVEANGGRIWVGSEMDEGSTFSFMLPLEGERLPPGEGWEGSIAGGARRER
jgi:signal transduction histidine kinase/GAF domain-containing protein